MLSTALHGFRRVSEDLVIRASDAEQQATAASTALETVERDERVCMDCISCVKDLLTSIARLSTGAMMEIVDLMLPLVEHVAHNSPMVEHTQTRKPSPSSVPSRSPVTSLADQFYVFKSASESKPQNDDLDKEKLCFTKLDLAILSKRKFYEAQHHSGNVVSQYGNMSKALKVDAAIWTPSSIDFSSAKYSKRTIQILTKSLEGRAYADVQEEYIKSDSLTEYEELDIISQILDDNEAQPWLQPVQKGDSPTTDGEVGDCNTTSGSKFDMQSVHTQLCQLIVSRLPGELLSNQRHMGQVHKCESTLNFGST